MLFNALKWRQQLYPNQLKNRFPTIHPMSLSQFWSFICSKKYCNAGTVLIIQ